MASCLDNTSLRYYKLKIYDVGTPFQAAIRKSTRPTKIAIARF